MCVRVCVSLIVRYVYVRVVSALCVFVSVLRCCVLCILIFSSIDNVTLGFLCFYLGVNFEFLE